jgi:hypothetical protein
MTVVADARRDGDIMHLPDFFRVEHEGQALLQLGDLAVSIGDIAGVVSVRVSRGDRAGKLPAEPLQD